MKKSARLVNNRASLKDKIIFKYLKLKHKQKNKLNIVLIGIIAVVAIAVIMMLIMFMTNRQPEAEIDIRSDEAAEIDPTNYNISEDDKNSLKNKFDELLGDTENPNAGAVYEYFSNEINSSLNKGDTKRACTLLWVEHDAFMEKGMHNEALEALLRMDDSKLEKYQKIYLYRAIVTASVITEKKDIEDKYTALVQELDPPAVIPADVPAEESSPATNSETQEAEVNQ